LGARVRVRVALAPEADQLVADGGGRAAPSEHVQGQLGATPARLARLGLGLGLGLGIRLGLGSGLG